MRSVVKTATSRGALVAVCLAQTVIISFLIGRMPGRMERDVKMNMYAMSGLSQLNAIQAGQITMLTEQLRVIRTEIDRTRSECDLEPIYRPVIVQGENDDE